MGLKPSDVDVYALNWDPKLYSIDFRRRRFEVATKKLVILGILGLQELPKYVWNYLIGDPLVYARKIIIAAISALGEPIPSEIKIVPVPHHLAHAASAYYFSGFDDATVITLDGSGEYEATVVWKVKRGNFEKILSMYTSYASLGFLYDAISAALGLGVLEGPGKVMGLAPYGKESEYYRKLKEIVKISPDGDEPFYITYGGC